MRLPAPLLLFFAFAAAGEEPGEGLADPYWGFTLRAPGLERGLALGGGAKLFEGRAAGGVDLEITVQEGATPQPGTAWRAAAEKAWDASTRARLERERGDDPAPHHLFVEEGRAGFRRHHGYAYFARGYHCFVLHAVVGEKSEASAAAIRAAFTAFTLAEKARPALLVHLLARAESTRTDDPRILLRAGRAYLLGDERLRQAPNPALAIEVLEQAAGIEDPEAYDAVERWTIHETLGLAALTLRRTEEAIVWLSKAEALARALPEEKSDRGRSSYNLACALSVAKRIDAALEAFRRALARGPRDEWLEHARTDDDLIELRNDPRYGELARGGG
ncbi:MAG: TPR end-of-group domain-containing protein [Planctomycetaceae bacterium]